MIDWSQWPNLSEEESRCHDGTPLPELPGVIDYCNKLQSLRTALGFAFHFSSWYRPPEYNKRVSSTGLDGPHTTGRATDILVYGEQALMIVKAAPDFGFTGIGLKQHGSISSRFVHIDDLLSNETRGPRPWIWTYD